MNWSSSSQDTSWFPERTRVTSSSADFGGEARVHDKNVPTRANATTAGLNMDADYEASSCLEQTLVDKACNGARSQNPEDVDPVAPQRDEPGGAERKSEDIQSR